MEKNIKAQMRLIGSVLVLFACLSTSPGDGPVVSPPVIDRFERDANSIRFHFTGQPPYDYTVEFTDSLTFTNWSPLVSYRAKVQTIDVVVTNSLTNAQARFFRVRQEPCYCR